VASGADLVVSAMVGAVGLEPTLAAIDAGLPVALAKQRDPGGCRFPGDGRGPERGVSIIPVDSEHSAIFQALHGQRPEDVRQLWLTASEGRFAPGTWSACAGATAPRP